MGTSDGLTIRAATPGDAAALAEIYADAVLHGFGTFEEVPPSPGEMAGRLAKVRGYGLPWLLAERSGQAAGYAYASPFRPRSAYRYTAEDTVYVHPGHKGTGVGRALLAALIGECEALGLRQLVAAVGDSDNAGSIALHRALGFQDAGLLPALGWKHGRWLDVVFMRRTLNGGAATAPTAAGLTLDEAG
jgi:phosphinothricin acetyltransferase